MENNYSKFFLECHRCANEAQKKFFSEVVKDFRTKGKFVTFDYAGFTFSCSALSDGNASVILFIQEGGEYKIWSVGTFNENSSAGHKGSFNIWTPSKKKFESLVPSNWYPGASGSYRTLMELFREHYFA